MERNTLLAGIQKISCSFYEAFRRRFVPSRAVAIVEFAITVPLMVLILIGALEFGRFFYQYLILLQVANAAARAGIQLSDLKPYCFENSAVINLGYLDNPSEGGLTPHWLAQRRAKLLLDQYQNELSVIGDGPDGAVEMSSEYISDPTKLPGSGCASVVAAGNANSADYQNSFAIRLEADYAPLLVSWTIPIKIEGRALYLSSNETFPVFGAPPPPAGSGFFGGSGY